MKIERTSGVLRTAGDTLFALIEELTGSRPELSGTNSDIYKGVLPETGIGFVYLRLVERGGTKNPPMSVDLHTRWNEQLANNPTILICRVTEGKDWYGTESSANMTARVLVPGEVEDALTFIRSAFQQFSAGGAQNV